MLSRNVPTRLGYSSCKEHLFYYTIHKESVIVDNIVTLMTK